MYCSYFQARVKIQDTWFFVATLRSNEHLCFDRTLDATQGIFEFYVPHVREAYFIALMDWYQKQGVISEFVQKENRLLDEQAVL